MDYQIILSPRAVRDLEAIVRYIAFYNPETAKKLGQKLLDKTQELSKFPLRGQTVLEFDDPSLRQLILRPYRIIYKVDEEKKRVSIARFWHTSQDNIEL